jgi:hypothetical protein
MYVVDPVMDQKVDRLETALRELDFLASEVVATHVKSSDERKRLQKEIRQIVTNGRK